MQALIFVLVGLCLAAGNYAYDVLKLGHRSAVIQQVIVSKNQIAQAQSILVTESADSDGDGYLESPAFTAWGSAPTGGGSVPVASGAGALVDGWGTKLGYCPFDNGTTNSSASRITGDNPGTQSSVLFALVSAGADKTFSTTCAQAKTGTAQSDDIVSFITIASANQGVGGTVYWGDPVASLVALNALNTSALKNGQLRITLDTNTVYRWNSGTGLWVAATSAGGGSTPTPPSYTGTNPTILNAGGTPIIAVNSGSTMVLASDGFVYAAGLNTTDNSTFSSWGDLTSNTKLSWYKLPSMPAGTVSAVVPTANTYGLRSSFLLMTDGNLYGVGFDGTSKTLTSAGTNLAAWTNVYTGVKKALLSRQLNGTDVGDIVVLKTDNNLYAKGTVFGSAAGTQLTTNGAVASFASSLYTAQSCLIRVDTDGQLWTRILGGAAQYCSGGLVGAAWAAISSQVSAAAVSNNNAPGLGNILAIKSDATVVGIGANSNGELGLGNTTATQTTTGSYTTFVSTGLTGASLLAMGPGCSYVVKGDGTLWSTGLNTNYNLGINASNVNKTAWTQASITGVSGIYPQDCNATIVTKTDGTVWGIGNASNGKFGKGVAGATYSSWTQLL